MPTTTIGRVIAVNSGQVRLRIDAQEREVEQDGRRHRVGQIGSYVTIHGPDRRVIAFVTSNGLEEGSAALGERLEAEAQLVGEIVEHRFSRGVSSYPVVGDAVSISSTEDFRVIFGGFAPCATSSPEAGSTFHLGRFAQNSDFAVHVRGSDFFSKSSAILGNSGSGKSCTTARILHEIVRLKQAQVVLFDMHGEYREAFKGADDQVNANVAYLGTHDLVLPYWLMKYEEMEEIFIDRSDPTTVSAQISFLRSALLEFKRDAAEELHLERTLTLDTPVYFSLEQLKLYAENLNDARYVLNDSHLAFTQLALRSMDPAEQQRIMRTQRCDFNKGNPEGETPHTLYFGKLVGLIDRIDTLHNDRRFSFMLRPLEHSEHSWCFRDRISAEQTAGQASTVMNYLIMLLTGRGSRRTNITIVDLSGIPYEIVDITVAVLTRLLFELNFWTPASVRHPILLAFEEAHNYIPRNGQGRQFARRAVERVAKEGRKYGVSAMVISQRPAELSETVLSQCGNLIALRMNNPEDQHYVAKVVGDQFAGMIQMLPILRPGEAFVIGDSVVMPMRTVVELPARQPQSGSMDYFGLWAREAPRGDINDIIEHWRRQDRHVDLLPVEAEVHTPPALSATNGVLKPGMNPVNRPTLVMPPAPSKMSWSKPPPGGPRVFIPQRPPVQKP